MSDLVFAGSAPGAPVGCGGYFGQYAAIVPQRRTAAWFARTADDADVAILPGYRT